MFHHSDQIIHEWRMGRAVKLYSSNGQTYELLATEFVDPSNYHGLIQSPWSLVITQHRAEALHASVHHVGLGLYRPPQRHHDLLKIIDPTLYMHAMLSEPLVSQRDLKEPEELRSTLQMLLKEDILPSLLIRTTEEREDFLWKNLDGLEKQRLLQRKYSAKLPLHNAHESRIHILQESPGTRRHVLLEIHAHQQPSSLTPLVRVHSECLTGDVFGSLKCDCGPQLRAAIDAIIDHGYGYIFYMRDEGRNIGITNKIRAYRLQDEGHDTYKANRLVGADEDLRDYKGVGHFIQEQLGLNQIQLLTSNAEKSAQLSVPGLHVEQVHHAVGLNPFNENYLKDKDARNLQYALDRIQNDDQNQ